MSPDSWNDDEPAYPHGPRIAKGSSKVVGYNPSCGYIHSTIMVDDDYTQYYGKLPVPITIVTRPKR